MIPNFENALAGTRENVGTATNTNTATNAITRAAKMPKSIPRDNVPHGSFFQYSAGIFVRSMIEYLYQLTLRTLHK